MKILIIGGSRFVGPLVIEKLLNQNHQVAVFNRGIIKSSYKRNVNYILGDRDNGFNIPNHFDVVIDMCAYRGEQTEKVIKQLSFNLLVHISTVSVYKKTESFPLKETSPIGKWPIWGEYNQGKVACEKVLKKSGIKYASIRPVFILGQKNFLKREEFIYKRLRRKQPIVIPGNGKAIIQFVFSSDVAKSIIYMVENKKQGIFNCAANTAITLRGLVKEMGKIAKVKPIIHYNPQADGGKHNKDEFPFANENVICSNEKIKKLGITFSPLFKSLKNNYETYYINKI